MRIDAVLRRSSSQNSDSSITTYQIGLYTYDASNYTLQFQGETKKLTKKEAEILKILCENKDKVVERNLVLNLVWGDDSYFNGRSLDVFITKLRKYLKNDEAVKITNIHGVGFKLEG